MTGAEDESIATTDLVLAHLIERLADGRYRPGQTVNVARLCQVLNLSKAPVREALHVLAGEGVITWHRNRGAVISDLTDRDLVDLWELFSLNFGREVRLAALALSDADVPDLEAAMHEIRDLAAAPIVDPLDFLRAFHRYHDLIARLCPNKFIVPAQVRRLSAFWDPYVVLRIPVEQLRLGYARNYQRIHDAVIAGDGKTAESAFHHHARWSVDLLLADTDGRRSASLMVGRRRREAGDS